MDPITLNEMLSLYALSMGSRNALVICYKIATRDPAKGEVRTRFYHWKEVAVPFRLMCGVWWWGDEGK